MTGEVIIQLPRSCLYWHMTGEVIIQLPRLCIRDSIWVAVCMISPVICQYIHNLGRWMMTSLVIWQYRDSIPVAGCDWRSHHPVTQIMSILTYDWRSHHPATRSCLYTVIWLEKSSSSYPDTVSSIETWSGSWIMTSPVIWQYRDMIG
jgi:hypothetical protein